MNRRCAIALCAMLAAAVTGGCGGQTHHAVSLSILAPTDGSTVSVRSVMVIGSVSPRDAIVSVSGHPAPVHSGQFHMPYTLSGSVTHITIAATASGYKSATTGITVHYKAPQQAAPSASSTAAASFTPGPSRAVLMARANRLCTSRNAKVAAEPQPLTTAALARDTTENVGNNDALAQGLDKLAGEAAAGQPLTGLATGIGAATQSITAVTNELSGGKPHQAQQQFTQALAASEQLDKKALGLALPQCAQTALSIGGSTAAIQTLINHALHPPAKKKKKEKARRS